MSYFLFYNRRMERIGIRELNQRTSQVIERVRRGEVVEVTERGRLVARLVPAEPAPEPLERLVAEGRATPPTLTGPVPMPPVLGDPDVDVGAALAASRDDERW
jgi:prevent-host-death family protein